MTAAGVVAGWRIGIGRAHEARVLAAGCVALGLSISLAVVERRAGLLGAASRVLEGSIFAYLIPIVVLLGSAHVLGQSRLDVAATTVARFGASRRAVALGFTLATMLLTAVVSAVVAATAACIAHDPTAPPLARDVLTTAWIGGLTACAYAGLYTFGATFGRRGGGRLGCFVIDLVVGSSGTAAAFVLPRGHAENLLGSTASLSVAQAVSAPSLALIAILFVLLAIRRCPP